MQRKTCRNSTWLDDRDDRCSLNSPLFPSKPSLYLCCWYFSSSSTNLQRPLSFPLPDFFSLHQPSLWLLGAWPFKEEALLVLLRTATAVCVCVCVCGFCLMLQWAAAEVWLCPPQAVCFGPLPLSDLDLVTKFYGWVGNWFILCSLLMTEIYFLSSLNITNEHAHASYK